MAISDDRPSRLQYRKSSHSHQQHLSDADIRRLFDALDADRSGELTLAELSAAAAQHRMGIAQHPQQALDFMRAADKDNSSTLSYQEFHQYVRSRERYLASMFDGMDRNHDGLVDKVEMRAYLSRVYHRWLSQREVDGMMDMFDKDHNGSVEFKELLQGAVLTAGDTRQLFDVWSHQTFFLHSDSKPAVPTPVARTLLSGFVAGAVSRTATAPFDRAALVMRAGSSVHTSPHVAGILRSMVKVGGLRSLWFGNGINVLQVGPESALMFYLYGWLKPMLFKDEEHPSSMEKFAAGGLAGFLSMTAVYPLYVAQARIGLAESGTFKGLPDFFLQTYRKDGLTAFTSGYTASALRIFPYKGIDMLGYMSLRDVFVPPGQQPSVYQSLAFGAGASAISQMVTAPLLTVRTKLMSQAPSLGRPLLYTGVLDCMRKVVHGDAALGLRPEGVGGLYRGLSAYLMKMCPASALTFATFEAADRFLAGYMQ